jgi:hypothetical protein
LIGALLVWLITIAGAAVAFWLGVLLMKLLGLLSDD